jgi:hypothetical protein
LIESFLLCQQVYKTVCNYLKGPQFPKGELVAEEVRFQMFENVRFAFMKYEELEETLQEPLVPPHLIAEGLLERLRTHERPEKSPPPIPR